MAYFELYCDPNTGNVMYGGDGGTLSQATNGDWNSTTANRFIAASGTPFSGASIGQVASIFLDGATTPVFLGLVTAVNGGGSSVDISTTYRTGTAPTAGTTGRSINIGGKWLGFHGGVTGFFTTTNLGPISGDLLKPVRVNLKNGTTYVPTASSWTPTGAVFEGYTTTPGDGGYATIDFGTVSLSVAGLRANESILRNLLVTYSGSTASVPVIGGGSTYGGIVERCGVILNTTANCYGLGGGNVHYTNCFVQQLNGTKAYSTGLQYGPPLYENCTVVNCGTGLYLHNSGAGSCVRCRFLSCGTGINSSQYHSRYSECDFYNCGTAIYNWYYTGPVHVQNCNFGLCGTVFAPFQSGTGNRSPWIVRNCGYGGGAFANTTKIASGRSNCIDESGAVNYTGSPWTDAANGDLTLADALAKTGGYQTLFLPWTLSSSPVGTPQIGSMGPGNSSGSGAYNPFRAPSVFGAV